MINNNYIKLNDLIMKTIPNINSNLMNIVQQFHLLLLLFFRLTAINGQHEGFNVQQYILDIYILRSSMT